MLCSKAGGFIPVDNEGTWVVEFSTKNGLDSPKYISIVSKIVYMETNNESESEIDDSSFLLSVILFDNIWEFRGV